MSVEQNLPNDAAVNTSSHSQDSSGSELETPDVSTTSSTFSDLGDTSIVSRKQKHAAMKWSKKEKRKTKELEKKKLKNKISKQDFCSKSLEFKAWLQEKKHLNFEDLDPKKQKEYFKKFIKKWNSKKLDKKYYRGVDCLWAQGTPNTQISWAMPGAIDVTPGSLPEGQLEEKYSRSRGSVRGAGLGTFGKKAGAEMLRELRAMENMPNIDLQNEKLNEDNTSLKEASKPVMTAEYLASVNMQTAAEPAVVTAWPAPPPPLPVIDQCQKAASDVDEMSPLPPPPLDSKTEISTKSTAKGLTAPPENKLQTQSHTVMRHPSHAPAPPPRTKSMCTRSDSQKLRSSSCSLEASIAERRAAVAPMKRRPVSYAGESSHLLPPPKPTNFKVPAPRKPTATVQPRQQNNSKATSVLAKCVSYDGIPQKSSVDPVVPPALPDRSVSLEHLPKEPVPNQHIMVVNPQSHHGPPLPKVPRQTRSTAGHIPTCSGDSTTDLKADSNSNLVIQNCPKEGGDLKRKHPPNDLYKSGNSQRKYISESAGETTPVSSRSSSLRK